AALEGFDGDAVDAEAEVPRTVDVDVAEVVADAVACLGSRAAALVVDGKSTHAVAMGAGRAAVGVVFHG
ncbi:MAG: hypothetical protein R6V12_16705, partial [Candidatus Hydrogenedentota bacterium]